MSIASNEVRYLINKYTKEITSLDNEKLFEAYTELAGGDDYDAGCFTTEGEWKWRILESEFKSRLKAYGFFGKRTVLTEKRYNR